MSDQETAAERSQSTNGPKARPTKPLPTDRIAFPKQLDILRAYAAASGSSNKAVSNRAVADIVGMNPSTISLSNSFFVALGFLYKTDVGYTPASEVMAFNLAYEWNPNIAGHKLAPLVEKSWFAQALMPKLRFRQLDEQEALTTLADVASAGPEYRSQLAVLLDYLEISGLTTFENGILRISQAIPSLSPSVAETIPPQEKVDIFLSPAREKAAPTPPTIPSSGVSFNIDLKVDMAEFSQWPADRISAFFAGIAQVLAAKGSMNKKASDLEK